MRAVLTLRACWRSGEATVTDVGDGAQARRRFLHRVAGAARAVGEAWAPLANLINLLLIVLGGSVAQTGDVLLTAVREAIYVQSHPSVTRDIAHPALADGRLGRTGRRRAGRGGGAVRAGIPARVACARAGPIAHERGVRGEEQ